jgi:hypothetical protein
VTRGGFGKAGYSQLLGCAGTEDRGHRQRGAKTRHPDAGIAPEQRLVDDRQQQLALICPELSQPLTGFR